MSELLRNHFVLRRLAFESALVPTRAKRNKSLRIRKLASEGYEILPCNVQSTPLSGKMYDMRKLSSLREEQEKTVQPPVVKILKNPERSRSHEVHRTSVQRQSWVNSVDPWLVEWIKKIADKNDDERTLKHLQSFVHDTRQEEVTPTLIRRIKELPTAEALLSLRELQRKPRFVQRKRSKDSLEVKAMVARPDGSKLPIVALVDSGCSGLAIDENFIKEHNLQTHDIPVPIPVYNADGTMNKGGTISKFTMVELVIGEHSE